MTYKTLGIDLDGTTYDFFTVFRNHWAELQNINPEPLGTEPLRWGFFEDWGCTIWKFHSLMRENIKLDGRLYTAGLPYSDAPEVLQRLSENHKIVIITSRCYLNLEEQTEKYTTQWLEEYKIPYDDLIFSDEKTNRGIDLMLDDAPHIIKKALEMREDAILFDSPQNRHIDHIRVTSWLDFERFVNG